VQGDDAAVDLGADRAVSDVGVNGIREVDRRRPGGQRLHLSLRREDVHLFVEDIHAERLHELARIRLLRLHVHQLLDPSLPVVVPRPLAALVKPVGGDAELGLSVHLPCSDLQLERTALGTDDRRVQGAIAVELRHRDVVLEATRHRLPERVDEAERAVTVARSLITGTLDRHAHRREVVDLVELAALLRHLVVDGVEVLRAR
jgi:hypothetical protein